MRHVVFATVLAVALLPVALPVRAQKPGGGGCDVTVYEDARLAGAARHHTDNVPWVGNAWNDRISSIVITSGVWQFFWDRDYAGEVLTLNPGVHEYVGDRWNDQISSFRCVQPTR